jgi:hypothetical protein
MEEKTASILTKAIGFFILVFYAYLSFSIYILARLDNINVKQEIAAAVVLVIALVTLWGLWKHKHWARYESMVLLFVVIILALRTVLEPNSVTARALFSGVGLLAAVSIYTLLLDPVKQLFAR